MSYPDGVAAGTRLIAAARKWLDADQAFFSAETHDRALNLLMAEARLREAAIAHRDATEAVQPVGPDIDADVTS